MGELDATSESYYVHVLCQVFCIPPPYHFQDVIHISLPQFWFVFLMALALIVPDPPYIDVLQWEILAAHCHINFLLV